MKIEYNKWVSINYTVKDDKGNIIDTSEGKEPLNYIHGNGYLIIGLENALEGKKAGEKISTIINPKDGYGEYDSQLIITLDRSQFDFDGEIQVGMPFQVMTPQGLSIVHIKKVEDNQITIDGNHELAGKVLHFDVEILEVRNPTEEELKPKHSCGGHCSGNCGDDCNVECEGNCNNCKN